MRGESSTALRTTDLRHRSLAGRRAWSAAGSDLPDHPVRPARRSEEEAAVTALLERLDAERPLAGGWWSSCVRRGGCSHHRRALLLAARIRRRSGSMRAALPGEAATTAWKGPRRQGLPLTVPWRRWRAVRFGPAVASGCAHRREVG